MALEREAASLVKGDNLASEPRADRGNWLYGLPVSLPGVGPEAWLAFANDLPRAGPNRCREKTTAPSRNNVPMKQPAAPLIPGAPLRRLTGSEEVMWGEGRIASGTVLDFWRWAAGDLRGNALRGHFAEWLVGLLLGVEMTVRQEWDSFDLSHGETKVEVKSSAYIQGWGQRAVSRITFGALLKQPWDPITGTYQVEASLNADWYVFALEKCKVGPDYDPLDLSQWEFYIVPSSALSKMKPNQTLSLQKVADLAGHPPMTAYQLHRDGPGMIGRTPVLIEDATASSSPRGT